MTDASAIFFPSIFSTSLRELLCKNNTFTGLVTTHSQVWCPQLQEFQSEFPEMLLAAHLHSAYFSHLATSCNVSSSLTISTHNSRYRNKATSTISFSSFFFYALEGLNLGSRPPELLFHKKQMFLPKTPTFPLRDFLNFSSAK